MWQLLAERSVKCIAVFMHTSKLHQASMRLTALSFSTAPVLMYCLRD
jgi:hypothetical protein